MELEILHREPLTVDWATLLFVATLGIIVITRNAFPVRFFEFLKLFISNKYLSTYRDANNIKSGFTISLFVVQLVSLSVFIHYVLAVLGLSYLDDITSYARVFSVLLFFILIKYFLEQIIAVCFGIEEFVGQYNLVKLTYRSFIGLLMFPIVVVLFYNQFLSTYLLWGVLIAFALSNLVLFILLIKNHQKLISRFILYFILYLCTFEIAPYIILYHWFAKS